MWKKVGEVVDLQSIVDVRVWKKVSFSSSPADIAGTIARALGDAVVCDRCSLSVCFAAKCNSVCV